MKSIANKQVMMSELSLNIGTCIFVFQSHVEDQLRMPWNWMVGVMDATEAQLRFGTALVSSTDSNNPNHPMHPSYGRQMEQAAAGRSSNSRAVQGLSHKRPRLSGGGELDISCCNVAI